MTTVLTLNFSKELWIGQQRIHRLKDLQDSAIRSKLIVWGDLQQSVIMITPAGEEVAQETFVVGGSESLQSFKLNTPS